MGIPRLTQTLQPFAERVVLGQKPASTQPSSNDTTKDITSSDPSLVRVTSVVIDGPSLVYHIYHRLLSLKAAQYRPCNSTILHSNSDRSPTHPILVQPKYRDINQATLAFINHLQSDHAIEVQKVYFDGALPVSKRNVRLARLEDGRRKLVEFRTQYPNFARESRHGRHAYREVYPFSSSKPIEEKNEKGSKTGKHDKGNVDAEALFQIPSPLPPIFKSLPPPPFMVPAVIEYLQSHINASNPPSTSASTSPLPQQRQQQHRSPIRLVPAEADTYCAFHAQQTGAAILTSDSDLLAYDLGNQGSVVMLNSLELSTNSEEDHSVMQLTSLRYHAPSLISRLGIPCSLQRFCFHRSRDAGIGTSELKFQCHKELDVQSEGEWSEFVEGYCLAGVVLQDDDGENLEEGHEDSENAGSKSRTTQWNIQGIDPRPSELVTQLQGRGDRFCSTNVKPGRIENDEETDLHMYLPLLIEDPSRDSAWSYGRSIRTLAYRMLLRYMPGLAGPRQVRIKEFQRRGARIVSISIEIDFEALTVQEIDDEIETLLHSFRSHKEDFSSSSLDTAHDVSIATSQSYLWRSFAFSHVSEQRRLDSKAPPSEVWVKRYLKTTRVQFEPTSWDDIHNQASVEAVLYSLRMLKQIAGLMNRCSSATSRVVEEEAGRMSTLFEALAGLPSIEEVMEPEVVEMTSVTGDINGGDTIVNASANERGDPHIELYAQAHKKGRGESDHALKSAPNDVSKDLLKRARKRQKRSRNSKQEKGGRETVKKQTTQSQKKIETNMFAVLEIEG